MSTATPIVATSRQHLDELIHEAIGLDGNQCDLNHIDVSGIEDFSWLFSTRAFNGDISQWNVSKGGNFAGMFENQPFTGDISRWNVSQAWNMKRMFRGSAFNGDISAWDVSNVRYISGMFKSSAFAQDVSMWNLSLEIGHIHFRTIHKDNKHFLAGQSLSPWVVAVHLASGSVPKDPAWVRAFEQTLALGEILGLPFIPFVQAIVDMHASMGVDPKRLERTQQAPVDGALFE